MTVPLWAGNLHHPHLHDRVRSSVKFVSRKRWVSHPGYLPLPNNTIDTKADYDDSESEIGALESPEIPRLDPSQSPFFTKLPAELRVLIYRHYLASYGSMVHISELYDRETKHKFHSCLASTKSLPGAVEWEYDYHDFFRWSTQPAGLKHRDCFEAIGKRHQSITSDKQSLNKNSLLSLMLTCSKM
jgi:hypothetical protein